jgi:DNA-binding transcriptional LysR family regulator
VAFVPYTNAGSLERIERGTFDFTVGMFPSLPRHVRVLGLVLDHHVCVMRCCHPLARWLSLDAVLAASRLLVTPSGLDLGAADGWLRVQGRSHDIVAVVTASPVRSASLP